MKTSVSLESKFDELVKLIKDEKLNLLRDSIELGFPINFVSSKQNTLLIYAAQFQKLKIVKFLVDQGADVNFKESCGYKASDVAAWHGEYRMGAQTEVSQKIIKFLGKYEHTNN